MSRGSIGFALAIASSATAALAHHGNSEYDLTVIVRYEGVISEQIWKNPHTLTRLETRTEAGEPIILEVEGGPRRCSGQVALRRIRSPRGSRYGGREPEQTLPQEICVWA
jgi:hypothetical protein